MKQGQVQGITIVVAVVVLLGASLSTITVMSRNTGTFSSDTETTIIQTTSGVDERIDEITTTPICTDTCLSLGYECDTQTICAAPTDCGTCIATETCNAAGKCVALCTDTCLSLGYECGTQTVCAAPTDCGTCIATETCNAAGKCVAVCTDTCLSLGYECGTQTVCAAPTDCGTCIATETCNAAGKCVPSAALTAAIVTPKQNMIFKKGSKVLFNSSVSGGVPPYTYLWQYPDFMNFPKLIDFGDQDTFNKTDLVVGWYEIYLTVKDSSSTTVSIPFTPPFGGPGINIDICDTPKAAIISPKDGDVFEELDEISFQPSVFGFCGTDNYFWTSSIDGHLSSQWMLKLQNLSLGVHLIEFNYTDDVGSDTHQISITVKAPPMIKAMIISPEDGQPFSKGDTISFDGMAAGGTPPYTYSWKSSIDGNFGNTKTYTINSLSAGDHMITFDVTDSTSATNSTVIDIHIPEDYFDWRDISGKNWMTSVKSQGGCGSCWAFATVGVMEAKYNIQENNPNLDIDLSEQYLVSGCCASGSCTGGWFAGSCIKNGIPDETCYPYVGANSICPATCQDGTAFKFYDSDSAYYNLYSTGRAGMQYTLSQKGPLSVYIDASSLKSTGRLDKDGCAIYSCGGGTINHAVVLVGYNNTDQYWIVKNSWGAVPANLCADGFESLDYNTCSTIKYGHYTENITAPI